MIRRMMLTATFSLSLAAGTAVPAIGQQATAQAQELARKAAVEQAQKALQAAVAQQLDTRAIEEIARQAEGRAREMSALALAGTTVLSDQQARELQVKVGQLAESA